MVHLTKQERSLIIVVAGLFLFGLVVKTYRQMHANDAPAAMSSRSQE